MLVDGGDVGESISKRRGWLTPMLWEALEELGYDLIAIGKRDLADTSFQWLKSPRPKKAVYLTGNASTKDGAPITSPFQVIKRAGAKIGVVSAISKRYNGYFRNYRIGPVAETIDKALAAFNNEKVDFRILIFHGPRAEARKLAKQYKDFDLFFLSSGEGRPMRTETDAASGMLMVGPGDRGREMAFVTLEKKADRVEAKASVIVLDTSVRKSSDEVAHILKRFEEAARARYARPKRSAPKRQQVP